jgi:FkbM family methyltransferase
MAHFRDFLASSLIGTPLQHPAQAIKSLGGIPSRARHPELREVFLEVRRIQELLRRTITPGMNCIDAGAHLGSILNEMVRRANGGRHIGIEPVPYKAAWLRRKFPMAEIHEVALGAEDATVEFFYHPGQSGLSGLRSRLDGVTDRLSVRCRRLDDLVPQGRRIGFVKMDLEGAEYEALRGARLLLTGSRPIVLFECTKSGLDLFGRSAADVFSLLEQEFGYHVYLIKDWLSGGPALDEPGFAAAMIYPFRAFNFVAAPAP